jgi:hypothetical protein
MTMFAEPLLAGGEERYGEREYQHQYNSHMEKGASRAYTDNEPEDREVRS